MSVVWLPMDDWSERLTLRPDLEVTIWRSDLPLPSNVDAVEFYVPEYLGSSVVHEVVARMPALRVVQTLTAGYESVLPYLRQGVQLCNARGVHDASTAELAVGLVLASLRGFPDFVRAQRSESWVHRRHQSLADKQVLVLGAGSVGTAVLRRLTPFEVYVVTIASRPRGTVRGMAELSSLLPNADVVILTVPLTDQTHHLVDSEFLSKMKDGALLVNVARGSVVATDALVNEVESGRLSAALDVTDPEPLPAGHPLWHLPNVFITPHVGGDTSAFLPRAWRLLQSQLDRFSAGAPLANVVS